MAKLYLGGVSTDPEVKQLDEHFTDLESMRGNVIKHEIFEAVINLKRSDNRYRTVLYRWRRKVERAKGIVISGLGEAASKGYKVLTHEEQLAFGIGQRKGAGRRIRRWHSSIATTDTDALPEEKRRVREHEMLSAEQVHTALMQSRKAVGLPGPAETQPVHPAAKKG